MDILDMLAERKIEEAIREGKLDDLPGKGKPLVFEEDNPLIPREMRALQRMLKQAGIIPGWIQQAKDTKELDREIEREQARLLRAHAHWSEELILIPNPDLLDRARRWHAASRERFVELVRRRAHLFRSYDVNAPVAADRSQARSAADDLRRFDKLFPAF